MKIKRYLMTKRQRAIVQEICEFWASVSGDEARIVSEVRSRSIYGAGMNKISLLASPWVHNHLRKYL